MSSPLTAGCDGTGSPNTSDTSDIPDTPATSDASVALDTPGADSVPSSSAEGPRSLIRRSTRNLLGGSAVWLLYHWLLRGWDTAPTSPHALLTALTVLAVWVATAGFLRGRGDGDRAAWWTGGVAAVVAAGSFAAIVVARPSHAGLAELPAPVASGLLAAVAAILWLWLWRAENRRPGPS